MKNIEILEEGLFGNILALEFKDGFCTEVIIADIEQKVYTNKLDLQEYDDHILIDSFAYVIDNVGIEIIKVNFDEKAINILMQLKEHYEKRNIEVVLEANQMYFTGREIKNHHSNTDKYIEWVIEATVKAYEYIYDITLKEDTVIKLYEKVSGVPKESFTTGLTEKHRNEAEELMRCILKLSLVIPNVEINEFVENYCK